MKPASISQDEINALFAQHSSEEQEEPKPAMFPALEMVAAHSPDPASLGLLANVEMEVTVNLGQTRRSIKEILALGPGSVVALERMAGEPVDVLVNGRLVARGEVVVIGENFGVRIAELIQPDAGGKEK